MNAKYYETYQNKSLGYNGVDWVCSLRKIPTWLRGTKFCITCSSLPHFAPSFKQLRNNPKCSQTLWGTPKHEITVQWVGSGAFVVNNNRDFVARTFALIAPVHPVSHQVCSYETIPNAPEHYETHQNMSLGSNGVDQARSLRKITTWLRGTNFCINCTGSVCFAPTFMHLRNDPNCPQILRNQLKH